MVKVKFTFDKQRMIRRCKSKKIRERLVVALMFMLMGIFLLCLVGEEGTVCQTSGILKESGLRTGVRRFNDLIKIDVDGEHYLISEQFSEIKLADAKKFRADLKSIKGKMVDLRYWRDDRIPTILELICDGKEYISFETTYSNIKNDRIESIIIYSLIIASGFLWLLFDLRVLRIYCRRKKQRIKRKRSTR